MPNILLVVDGVIDAPGRLTNFPPAIDRSIAALKQAILSSDGESVPVLLAPDALQTGDLPVQGRVCPLTLHLPESVFLPEQSFPEQKIFQRCRQENTLRQQVAQHLAYPTGAGQFWLPIVLTAKGPLYGEVIGLATGAEGQKTTLEDPTYRQPIHLSDRWRQPLYRLGQELIQLIEATPSVYLMQFGVQEQEICFDRLWPFPAAPAVASIGVQQPDLFECHWRCLTGQPIVDLFIPGNHSYQNLNVLSSA
ncbi:MAG: hypothetical protein SFW36_22045 [Leptolyngbyaceae cyanobacterium bins.59]|nr:hypothetical protein [Leptolyngbyaceae cyanobacterium bins.59]